MSRHASSGTYIALASVALAWVAATAVVHTAAVANHDPAKPDVPPPKPRIDEPTRQALLESFRAVVRGAMEDSDLSGRSTALMNIARAQYGLGDRDSARKTFESAAQAAVELARTNDQISWLRMVIESQLGTGDREGLRSTLDLLRKESDRMSIREKISCRTEIAKDLALAGDRDAAREKFQETFELLEGFGQNVGRWQIALKGITAAMASVGELDFALNAAEAVPVEERGIRATLIRTIVSEPTSAGPRAVADAMERALKLSDTLPGNIGQSTILEKLAVARAGIGDLPGALRCVDKVSVDVNKASVLGKIAEARAEAGDFKGAFETVRLIGKDAHDPRASASKPPALIAIALAQAAKKDVDGSRATFDEAAKATQDVDADFLKAEQLATIATARAGLGDIEGALKAVAMVEGDDHRKGLALVAIAKAQLRAGKKDTAIATLGRASEAFGQVHERANQINGSSRRGRHDAIRPLAGALAQAGRIDEALDDAKAIDDNYEREYAMTDIATAQAHHGDVVGALKTVSQISGMLRRALAFGQVAKAQAEAGHAAEARAWVDKLESPTFRARAYRAMVEALAEPEAGKK